MWPKSVVELQKLATGLEIGNREKSGPSLKDPTARMNLLPELLEKDEGNKEAVAALESVVDKKIEDTAPLNHNKVKSRGGRWANMERQLKEEEATVAKLKEQFKQHEDSAKERRRSCWRPAPSSTRRWGPSTRLASGTRRTTPTTKGTAERRWRHWYGFAASAASSATEAQAERIRGSVCEGSAGCEDCARQRERAGRGRAADGDTDL